MWVVINSFSDVMDGGHVYRVRGEYPRPGYEPSAQRIRELMSNSNRMGVPLIAEAEIAKPKKTRKGGKATNDDGSVRVPSELV